MLSPERLSRGQIDAVLKATRGNPLFVQEIVHALQRHDAAYDGQRIAGNELPQAKLVLPESITIAVSARIDTLDPKCTEVLTHAALLGDRFNIEQLAAVLAKPPIALLDALEPALRERLLSVDDDAFAFLHPLIRHVFYHRASPPRRQLMHLKIAEVLKEAPDATGNAAQIAHHLIAAGTHAGVLELAVHAKRAAEQSVEKYAWAEGARYFIAAAQAWERVHEDDHAELADLHLRAGMAFRNDGDRVGSVAQLDLAIDRYERAGNTIGAARALHARTRASFAQITYGAAVDPRPLEKAAALVEQRDPALAGLLKEALCELYWLGQLLDRAEPLGEQALQLGRELDNDLLRHHAALGLGLVRFQRLRFDDALDCYRESRDAAERLSDRWLKNDSMQRIPTVLQITGRLDEAERAAREALALATEIHNAAEASMALSHLSNLALARGELAEAESFAQSTLTMAQRTEYPWGGVGAVPVMAYARCLTGAFSEACDVLALLDTPGKVCETPGPQLELLAAIYRDLVAVLSGGPLPAALRERVHFYDAVAASRTIEAGTIAPLCALVEQAVAIGEAATIERACASLRGAYERGAVAGIGWVFLVPRVLGLGAAALGRVDEAKQCFEQALAHARRMGMKPERARTELDFARLLASQGDRRGAIELARAAAASFAEIGAVPWQGRALALLHELGARDSDGEHRRSQAPLVLSRRDADLLRRVARGQADDAIAEDLISNPITIAADIRSLLAKIGAERRGEALAFAYEQGLLARETVSGNVPLAIMVTDIDGFTATVQRLGDAAAQRLIQTHNGILRRCLRQHDGIEVTHTGDGMIASFVSAPSALRCAMELQREFAKHGAQQPDTPLRVRIGISAGTPRVEEDRLFGAVVIAAVRICATALAGQVLISDAVRREAPADVAIEPYGDVALKGFEHALHLHAVLGNNTTGE